MLGSRAGVRAEKSRQSSSQGCVFLCERDFGRRELVMKGDVRSIFNLRQLRSIIAGGSILLIGVVFLDLLSRQQAEAQVPSATSGADETQKIQDVQLDSLVAPIAVYPDPLLGQALVASTYPLELM